MNKTMLRLFAHIQWLSVTWVKARVRVISGFFGITAFLLLSACASTPVPPNQALQAAELAIANADQARVADYASLELRSAREKLTAARAAVQEENMVQAKRLAEQAQVDAELAIVKTDAIKAQRVNEELQKSIDAMKQEMQRNTGAQ